MMTAPSPAVMRAPARKEILAGATLTMALAGATTLAAMFVVSVASTRPAAAGGGHPAAVSDNRRGLHSLNHAAGCCREAESMAAGNNWCLPSRCGSTGRQAKHGHQDGCIACAVDGLLLAACNTKLTVSNIPTMEAKGANTAKLLMLSNYRCTGTTGRTHSTCSRPRQQYQHGDAGLRGHRRNKPHPTLKPHQ
jgi:hypothetical protein